MRRNYQTAIGFGRNGADAALDINRVVNGKRHYAYREWRGGGLRSVQKPDVWSRVRIENKSDPFGLGRNLPEQLEPFATDGILEVGENR